MNNLTPAQILDLPMPENDANAATIRDYLTALLIRVWIDEADFSGKRPFGNSGWQWDVYKVLAEAELLASTTDEFGELDLDIREAGQIMTGAIRALGAGR